MTLSTRLQKVTEALSPLQRAQLVLQAIREGRDVDPDIRDVKDPQERRAFNRYMALLWVANHQLGANAAITSFRVEAVEKTKWLAQILNDAADILDEHEGKPRSKPQKNWRKQKGEIEVSVFLRSIALECRDDAAALAEHLWREVVSLERVWQDLSAEFAGEDIALPEHRERIAQTASDLRELARALGIRKLPEEPDDELTRAWTDMVNEAFKHLGLVEPF